MKINEGLTDKSFSSFYDAGDKRVSWGKSFGGKNIEKPAKSKHFDLTRGGKI